MGGQQSVENLCDLLFELSSAERMPKPDEPDFSFGVSLKEI